MECSILLNRFVIDHTLCEPYWKTVKEIFCKSIEWHKEKIPRSTSGSEVDDTGELFKACNDVGGRMLEKGYTGKYSLIRPSSHKRNLPIDLFK